MAIFLGSQSQGTGLDDFTSWYIFPSAKSYNYNSLILPSISHTGDLGDTQLQPGDPRRLTCLDLPQDSISRMCMPQPVWESAP